MNKKEMILEAKKSLARKNFFDFCNLMAHKKNKKSRKYLVSLCDQMQDFYNSEDDILIITRLTVLKNK